MAHPFVLTDGELRRLLGVLGAQIPLGEPDLKDPQALPDRQLHAKLVVELSRRREGAEKLARKIKEDHHGTGQ